MKGMLYTPSFGFIFLMTLAGFVLGFAFGAGLMTMRLEQPVAAAPEPVQANPLAAPDVAFLPMFADRPTTMIMVIGPSTISRVFEIPLN